MDMSAPNVLSALKWVLKTIQTPTPFNYFEWKEEHLTRQLATFVQQASPTGALRALSLAPYHITRAK